MSDTIRTYSPATVASLNFRDGVIRVNKRNGEIVIATRIKFLILIPCQGCGRSNVMSVPLFLAVKDNDKCLVSLSRTNWSKHKVVLLSYWKLDSLEKANILSLINLECESWTKPEEEIPTLDSIITPDLTIE